MKTTTEAAFQEFFAATKQQIWWPSELANVFSALRAKMKSRSLKDRQILSFLLDLKILTKAEFTSARYRPTVRYIHGQPSPYQLATSLRRNSFLSHGTAWVLHGLKSPTTRIFVNQEQTPKFTSTSITQQGITIAFNRHQRHSQYVLKYRGWSYVLLNGKNTGRTGVIPHSARHDNEATVEVTDLERTLIDIVVRPAYAGGIDQVRTAYEMAAERVDIDHLVDLLQKVNYLYPYHQSIGFLLELSGRSETHCKSLMELGLRYDFYLDYEMKNPAYNERWKIFHPFN